MANFLLPISLISVGFFLNDPVALLAASIFSISIVLISIFTKNFLWLKGKETFVLLGLFLSYLVSSIVNQTNSALTLTGQYQRNFGLLTIFSLILIFAYSTSNKVSVSNFLKYSLYPSIGFALIYGLTQLLNFDPIPWTNPYKAIQITLGNPNFAGALLGIFWVITFSKILVEKDLKIRIFNLVTSLLLLILCLKTNSLQSLVLVVLTTLIFICIYYFENQKRMSLLSKNGITSAILLILGTIIVSFFTNIGFLEPFKNKLFFEGSISQRLDYWRTGILMFKDHFLFGVGPDKFQSYAAMYRTPNQIQRDGAQVIPDKAHSVLIDHFANGGIVAGSLWIIFIFLIFKALVKVMKSELDANKRFQVSVLGAIWTGYVFQSLISPDQLVLTILGLMSAGLIVQTHNKEFSIATRNSRVSQFFEEAFFFRILLAIVLVVNVFVWGKSIYADALAKKVLFKSELSQKEILQAAESWPSPKTLERMALATAQAEKKCLLTEYLANKLVLIDKRASQGWYIKAVCANQNRKFDSALEFTNQSLKYDPLNPIYIVAKSKLGIAANNKLEAKSALELLKKYYPTNEEIPLLDASIDSMK